VPRVLVVGGLEASGRVGLLADAEAVRAQGGVPLLVATSVTAQGRSTFSWQPVHPLLVAAQIRAALELGPVHAVKLGVLPGVPQLRAVQRALRGLPVPWVVDPVVRASSGGRLSGLTAGAYLGLVGSRVWLTPNALEAAWLLRTPPVRTVQEATEAGRALVDRGFGGVVVKGGHLAGASAIDVLARRGGTSSFRSPRLRRGARHRGTGCRLASALATELGRGTPPPLAVARARQLVLRFLRGATTGLPG
jgi:hydroxymethylpyrimidine/phosphomethylpyrimidine kinase